MYTLGIDLGTNSVKSLILELESGQVIGFGQRSYPYIEGTESEQDPVYIKNMVLQSIYDAIASSMVNTREIKAVGLSGQMHGTVLYNRNGELISNIITWEDRRCEKSFLDEIARIGGDDIQKSGCGISTGFLGPTLYHIVRNSKIDVGHVLLPTDWLRQELTGNRTFLTDTSNGSSSGFFHTQERDWNYRLIRKLGLSEEVFPKVTSTIAIDTVISKPIAEATGLVAGTPVAVGGGDQPLSMIGCGVSNPDQGIILNIGTGSQVSKVGEEYQKERETIVFCFPEKGYSLLGAALSGGAALKWWRTVSEDCARMYGISSYEGKIYQKMDQIAWNVPPGSDGLAFIPYLSGTRVQPELKASFLGISRDHSYAHFTRAVMEGVVFELYYLYEKLQTSGQEDIPIIAAGGGFSSQLWAQIASDIFDKEIKITQYQEQAALGDALIAGVAIGYYKNIKESCERVRYKGNVIKPNRESVLIYKDIYKTLYRENLGFTKP